MDYQTLRFFWNIAELALKAATELDRSRRDCSVAVEMAVESLLKPLREAVDLSVEKADVAAFQAVFELFRQVISPGACKDIKTTADLESAISSLVVDWRVRLAQREDAALYDTMRMCLDIHQFCLSRSMMSEQEELGFAA